MTSKIKELFLFKGVLFSEYGLMQAEKARQEACYSRAANYVTAIRSFTAAVGDKKLRKITPKVVGQYQQWLKDRGVSKNTISCYNRTLRAIYNRSVSDGLVSDRHPFDNSFTGRTKTDKRSISEDSIKRLRALDLRHNPELEAVRDYFLFSFYSMGMPFVDMACLRKDQIVDNVIQYHRRKTGSAVHVPLCDEARAIMAKYYNAGSPFVFPLLTERLPQRSYRQYCTRLNNYNRLLKQLARVAGISGNLSSYTVRHSWASIAYRSDVPLSVISQALGHKSTDITMTYIRELDVAKLSEGNEKVLKAIK